jgi:lipid II:glycine glycyltransferase (peptidoglycan interpeptide bridge formation enzyme)
MPVSERDSVLSALKDHLRHLLAKENAIVAEAQIAPLTPSLVHSRNSKVNPLIVLDFDNTQAETWMVDLSSAPDEIRRKYSELTRRELRKAARSDITLREASGTRDLEAYYRLHLETYSRTGATPHPIEYFQAIFERFQPSGLSRILFAERDGRIVAAQNTGRYKTGAIYWTGASVSEKAGGENRLLFDAQIMAARADGFAFYETGQAFVNSKDSKESGLSNFKRSFGAELYPYYQGILHSSRLVFRGLWSLRHLMRAVRNQ